jgi:hypothetical protein
MPSARQPAAALADRAERHVFALLGDLDAIDRRALALIELAGADRAAAARELGTDVAEPLARARKALRRAKAPLASGARCERAERLLSDRLDAPLDREPRKWLEIHLARCPRCEEHDRLLDEARTELRVTFDAAPPQLPPAPEPPRLAEPPQPRGHLRAVPEPAGDISRPTAEKSSPRPAAEPAAAAEPAPAAPSPPSPPAAATKPAAPKRAQPAPRERRDLAPAAKRAAALLALILAIAAIVAAAASLSGDDQPQRAPWDSPDAPEVHPAPLVDQ